jgi:hypothetical protein
MLSEGISLQFDTVEISKMYIEEENKQNTFTEPHCYHVEKCILY